MYPSDFPPRKTVHEHFRAWRGSGVWERIGQALREQGRKAGGRNATNSACFEYCPRLDRGTHIRLAQLVSPPRQGLRTTPRQNLWPIPRSPTCSCADRLSFRIGSNAERVGSRKPNIHALCQGTRGHPLGRVPQAPQNKGRLQPLRDSSYQ